MLSGGQAQLLSLLHGQGAAHLLRAVAQHGIAARLRDGPRSAQEVADGISAPADKVYSVMRALACFGVFTELEDGRFSLDDAGRALAENPPMHAAVMYATEPDVLSAWAELAASLTAPNYPFERAHGRPFYEHLNRNAGLAESFSRMMGALGRMHVPLVLEFYDFKPYGTVVDVGGGRGDLLIELLKRHPEKKGVLLDLPEVVTTVPADLPHDVRERLRIVKGSFFDVSVPGGDVYVLKNVIHNWQDPNAIRILRRCRQGMHPGARVILVEHVVPEGPGFHISKLLDITMLVTTGGRERSETQHREVLTAAGLKILRVITTPGPIAIVECGAA